MIVIIIVLAWLVFGGLYLKLTYENGKRRAQGLPPVKLWGPPPDDLQPKR